jgi:hypothetical protein
MWNWRRKPARDGFPAKFKVQRIGIAAAKDLGALPPSEIVEHLRRFPSIAKDLLDESYNKRYSPSTFIKEDGDHFTVGWYSKTTRYECIRQFSNLADAAADYLLFSLGKGRWTPE